MTHTQSLRSDLGHWLKQGCALLLLACGVCGVCGLCAAEHGALPQDSPGPSTAATAQDAVASEDVSQPGVSAHEEEGNRTESRSTRAPLLREGSFLVAAQGTLQRDDARGWWVYRIARPDPAAPAQELIVLPCTLLGQMRQMVESASSREVLFETTGQVFVYHDRNYLLPTHAPRLAARRPAAPSPLPESGESTTQLDTSTSDDGGNDERIETMEIGDSAAEIIRDVERAAGPITRPPQTSPPVAVSHDVNNSDDSDHVDDVAAVVAVDGKSAASLLREDTAVVSRRGTLTREAGGAWTFIFDADAAGLADPPLTILPCLLLERMETYTRAQGNAAPALLSGRVLLYNGRNYLLPAVFRIPHERTKITP